MKSGIYKILNIITNKFYIGSAMDIAQRWRQHKSEFRNNKHFNIHLQRAWNKNSGWGFEFIILELCEKDKLVEREQFYIDTSKPIYNLRLVAHSQLGFKHSEETKNKLRKIKLTEEAKQHLSKIKTGIIFSDETKLKMSINSKGKNAKPDKWPHLERRKCKCEECRQKRIIYMRQWKLDTNYNTSNKEI